MLFLAFCFSVLRQAQQPKKIPCIGYLAAPDAATETARAEGTLTTQALRERGYIDINNNHAIEYRYTQGKAEWSSSAFPPNWRISTSISSWSSRRRCLGPGGEGIRPSRSPSLWSVAGPIPSQTGLIESLAQPGANVTGLTKPKSQNLEASGWS